MSKEMCQCATCGYEWQRGMNGSHSCTENLLATIEKMKKESIKVWAFNRPYCSPASGTIQAKTGEEAMDLLHKAYGFASNSVVYCAETKETFTDKS